MTGKSRSAKQALLAHLMDPTTPAWTRTLLARDRETEAGRFSASQLRILFTEELHRGTAINNLWYCLRLCGKLDRDRFERAIESIAHKHTALRMYADYTTGEPVCRVASELPIQVELHHASSEAMAREISSDFVHRPFDLETPPLFRTALTRLGGEEHWLTIVVHHLIADGWSLGVFLADLGEAYDQPGSQTSSGEAQPASDYAQFVAWEREFGLSEAGRACETYWSARLAPEPGRSETAAGGDRKKAVAEDLDIAGALIPFSVPEEVVSRMRRLARSEKVSAFMFALAAFKVLLMQRSGGSSISIAVPHAGRFEPQFESLIGCCINLLVVHTRAEGDPVFREFLASTRDACAGAFAHARLPYDRVVDALGLRGREAGYSLCDAMFTFQNSPMPSIALGDIRAETVTIPSKFSRNRLKLELWPEGSRVRGFFEYRTSQFTEPAVERLIEDFVRILETVTLEPDLRLSKLASLLVDPAGGTAERRGPAKLKSTRRAAVATILVKESSDGEGGGRRTVAALGAAPAVREGLFHEGCAVLWYVEPRLSGVDVLDWVRPNVERVRRRLTEHGAVLLRGFEDVSATAFAQLTSLIAGELDDYRYRSTPRTRVEGRVFTSTEYPADQRIPLHHELSYSLHWPKTIAFCCVTPAMRGGETPIASGQEVHDRLRSGYRDKMVELGVQYVRNYHPALDLTWQEVFQTSSEAGAEESCRELGLTAAWGASGGLSTKGVCQATITHPTRGKSVWFNQAHLFHVSALPPEVREVLLSTFGADRLPRNAYLGNGAELDAGFLAEIRSVFEDVSRPIRWREGDVVLLDNEFTAHGRAPYEGQRRILCAMGQHDG